MTVDKEILLTAEQQNAINSLNIKSLNEMQCAAVEFCRENDCMVLLSPTGSGKTLACLLPLLEALDTKNVGIQALIVVPSRELAKQITEVWRSMRTGFSAVALYGGRSVADETTMMQGSRPALVVGTPGRLIDHLANGNLPVEGCSRLVIDEFDKCLEMGFQEDMERLVSMLPAIKARYLLSATDAAEISLFSGATDVRKLDFRENAEQPLQRTRFYKLPVDALVRHDALFDLLCAIGNESTIVFCNFRETVEEVRRFLSKKRLQVAAYHGAMEQRERESALYRFASGCVDVLVCTDLAARGLDINDVKHVIHFQRPMTKEIFTHRNGRTARWDAEGCVYMIISDNVQLPEFVPSDMCEYRMPKRIVLPEPADKMALYIGKGKRDKISRGDLVGFFIKKGGLHPDELGLVMVAERYSYVAVKRNKVRMLLQLLAGEKIKGVKTVIEPVRG